MTTGSNVLVETNKPRFLSPSTSGKPMARLLVGLLLCGSLAACSNIYRDSRVIEGSSETTTVEVVALTDATVRRANSSPFVPKSLPDVFYQTAGTGGALRKPSALPDGPVASQNRPTTIKTILPPTAKPGPYKIGVADVVLLSTPSGQSKLDELAGILASQNEHRGYTVLDDGFINIPKVGRVEIAGKTVKEAEAELFRQFVINQIEPTFSLQIAEFNSQKVSIGGAVARPGVVPVSIAPIYLSQAITAAGGIVAERQNAANVRLHRGGKLYQIPVSELFSKSGQKKIRLIDGDAVFVDTQYDLGRARDYFEQQILLLETRQRDRNTALNELKTQVELLRANQQDARNNYKERKALGADDADYVHLMGEVGKQSRYALPFDRRAMLSDALSEAQGVSPGTGDISQIYVLRAKNRALDLSQITAWHLDGRNVANFVFATAFELRPNDIVFVAQQPITRWDRTMSQIIPRFFSATKTVGN